MRPEVCGDQRSVRDMPLMSCGTRQFSLLSLPSSCPRHTNAHAQDIQDYKTRVPLIKTIKTEGADWVSKYARGGSARSDSARRMYIAVDALIGHLAANG